MMADDVINVIMWIERKWVNWSSKSLKEKKNEKKKTHMKLFRQCSAPRWNSIKEKTKKKFDFSFYAFF